MSYKILKLLLSVSKDIGGSTVNSYVWKLFFLMKIYPSPDIAALKLKLLKIIKNNF
jgi:hypothetical protein